MRMVVRLIYCLALHRFLPNRINAYQRLPTNSFFSNSLWPKNFEEDFIALHKLLKADYNNINIRKGRDRRIQSILDQLVEKMWSIRMRESGWSATDSCTRLPLHQKIWLDEARKEEREGDEEWIKKVIDECARWYKFAYEKVVGKSALLLADDELAHIKSIIEQNKEELL